MCILVSVAAWAGHIAHRDYPGSRHGIRTEADDDVPRIKRSWRRFPARKRVDRRDLDDRRPRDPHNPRCTDSVQ